MSISRKEIEHVSRLARIALSEEEKDIFTGQMDSILKYVDTLNELNTDGIIPTSHAVPVENRFRPDSVETSIGIVKALSNAPEASEACFRVPPVIE